MAKRAAEEKEGRAEPSYLVKESLAHLFRKTMEVRSSATAEWIRSHTGRRRRYRPPKGGKVRKVLTRVRKELVGLFYQLLSGHAATGEHLICVRQASSDQCF